MKNLNMKSRKLFRKNISYLFVKNNEHIVDSKQSFIYEQMLLQHFLAHQFCWLEYPWV